MARPAGRRKVRKRKVKTENSGVKLGLIAGIMLLAVFLGFLTARFVIGPIIGYNADESQIKAADESREKTDDEAAGGKESGKEDGADGSEKSGASSVSAVPAEGYALQFGAFSTREAAQKLSDTLKSKGIKTEVVEIDSTFKVISPVTDDKDDALKSLEDMKDKEVTDVFVTSFE